MAKPLLHGLTLEKWQLIQQAAVVLEVPALHLAAVIAFETGESFSSQVANPLSGAVGVDQGAWLQLQRPAVNDFRGAATRAGH